MSDILENGKSQQTDGRLRAQLVDSGNNPILTDKALGVTSYENLIAEGLIIGSADIHTLGRNNAVNNARVDIWTGPTGSYVFPPAGGIQMRIVSSNANDTLAGTGAQIVHIHYLDNSYNEQFEIVNLNGTTPVNTVATNILRINGVHVNQVGSGGTTAGNISLTNLASSITYAYIEAGYNEARQAIYTVPSGKKLFINHWQGSSGTASGSHFTRIALRTTSHDGVLWPGTFIAIDEIGSLNNGQSITFPIPIMVPATADVKMTSISDSVSANAIVMGAFHGWIE